MISCLIMGVGAQATSVPPITITSAKLHAGGVDELGKGGWGGGGDRRSLQGGSGAADPSSGILCVGPTTFTYNSPSASLPPPSSSSSIANGMMADETKALLWFVHLTYRRVLSTVLLLPSGSADGSCKTKTNPLAISASQRSTIIVQGQKKLAMMPSTMTFFALVLACLTGANTLGNDKDGCLALALEAMVCHLSHVCIFSLFHTPHGKCRAQNYSLVINSGHVRSWRTRSEPPQKDDPCRHQHPQAFNYLRSGWRGGGDDDSGAGIIHSCGFS